MMSAPRVLARTAALLLLLASASVAARSSQDDPQGAATLLASARQALGGDAALSAVATFTVKGSRTQTPGGPVSLEDSVDFACALPDRFVEHSHHSSNLGPLGMSSVSERHGFNGADLIDERDSDSPLPEPVVAGQHNSSAADIAKAREGHLRLQKRAFVEHAFPLFAASLDAAPLRLRAAGQTNGPTGPAFLIAIHAADGFAMTALLDARTHLVVGMVWQDKPIVVMSTHTRTAVRQQTGSQGSSVTALGPAPVLPGNPTADLPDVQWQMTVTDYRTEDGLNWPHRFTTSFGGHKFEDLRLGNFKINPKIDPETFRVQK